MRRHCGLSVKMPREWLPAMWTSHVAWNLDLGRSEEASALIEDYLKSTPRDPGGQVTGLARSSMRRRAMCGERRRMFGRL